MIRKRKLAFDDERIYSLIKKELLPFTRLTFPDVKFDKKEARERLDKGSTFVIEKDKNSILGFINVFVRGSDIIVDMLVIDKKQQRKGWGTTLLETVEQYGQDQGCRSISLYVDVKNKKARRFYAHRGYKKVRYNPAIHCNIMSKVLGK
jgi:ribosomal protein S18 acetylase RimI-like enzyme